MISKRKTNQKKIAKDGGFKTRLPCHFLRPSFSQNTMQLGFYCMPKIKILQHRPQISSRSPTNMPTLMRNLKKPQTYPNRHALNIKKFLACNLPLAHLRPYLTIKV